MHFLYLAISEMDQNHREEIEKVKEQSFKAIKELDQIISYKDEEFQKKIMDLNDQLKYARSSKQQ